MTGSKVLVFGGTGPAGICLLRELLFRNHGTIAYARNPSKIPEDLASNPLLEIIKGELADVTSLSNVVSNCSVIISLVGPNVLQASDPELFANFYRTLFPLMREYLVRRIFAMCTLSFPDPHDAFSLQRTLMVALVRTVVNFAYQMMHNIARAFLDEAATEGIDWTVYRIAGLPGGSSEEEWRKDRDDGESFEGWVGEKGWSMSQKRAALARWLVDAIEDGKETWVRKMPAISRLAGSKPRD